MTIKKMIKLLHDDGVNDVQIGSLIGRSLLQVQLYADGRTKKPGVKTALGIFRHITVNGEPLIVSDFRGKQDIFDKVKEYEMQCNQVIRDEGVGSYDIITKTDTSL